MKNPVFTGAGVAIITPMYEDGSINFDELGRIVEDQIARGTDAIVICGTTGECSTMTDEEQLAAIKYTVDLVSHRVPVIAGAGSNDTDHGCALAAKSAACGADALLLVTPYYNKTSQAGLVAHFTAMAEAGGIPVILYNVPSRTGLNIAPETAKELSKHPLINGIKEASGNIGQVAKIAALCGDELNIYSGNDDQVVPLLSLGGKGDVVIDFSAPAAVEKALPYCEAHKLPIVVCTTGLSEGLQLKLVQLSRSIPVFKSANMSMGINVLSELCKRASAILGANYDIEIVEQHHHNKLDAPSGTALMLADAINEENDGAYHYVYDRSAVRQKRDPKEIGISAVRGGSIVGDHEVLFCGPDEVITLRHTAYSRSIFANGAINAAVYLAKKEPGLYNMSNMIAEM